MHYMRMRRHGDPNAEFPPGRPPRPKQDDAALDSLRRDNAALRERIATLTRELNESRARAASTPGRPDDAAVKLMRERNGALERENRDLKSRLAKAEANPDERIVELERQLKGARTRAQNEAAKARIAWESARARGLVMSKADRRRIRSALHPDRAQDAVERKRLEAAFQIFEALPIRESDD
jgi:hypothetical protein